MVLSLLVDFVELVLHVFSKASDDVLLELVDGEVFVLPETRLLVQPLSLGDLVL